MRAGAGRVEARVDERSPVDAIDDDAPASDPARFHGPIGFDDAGDATQEGLALADDLPRTVIEVEDLP